MPGVYVSVGSNTNRYTHVTNSLDALNGCFGDLVISSVYECEAVGFSGTNFLNLVVGFNTHWAVDELLGVLRHIEDCNGRRRMASKLIPLTLDIDILTYGNFAGDICAVSLPREEITRSAYMLRPLVDIAPFETHPRIGKTYSELWMDFPKDSQKLWAVEFYWKNNQLSKI